MMRKKRVKTEVVREAHRAKVPAGKFPVGADNVDARLIKDVRPMTMRIWIRPLTFA